MPSSFTGTGAETVNADGDGDMRGGLLSYPVQSTMQNSYWRICRYHVGTAIGTCVMGVWLLRSSYTGD